MGPPITKVTQLATNRETDLTTAGKGLSSRNRSAHEPAKKERGIRSSSCLFIVPDFKNYLLYLKFMVFISGYGSSKN